MPDRTDVIYRYDGSFEGFLCCVFESYARHELPQDIRPEGEGQISLYPERYIETDRQHAGRVFASIPKKISREAARMVARGFLTCLEQKEMWLLRFLRLGYRYGRRVMSMLADEAVHTVFHAVQFLENESHLLKGFLRFSEVHGVLIAEIEPKNQVLPLLQEHFCARYSGERFLIYDRTHRMMLVYQPGRAELFPVEDFRLPEADAPEAAYRALWRAYYHTAAVEGRENPRCRMTHMPKRYWNCMTEFSAPEAPPALESGKGRSAKNGGIPQDGFMKKGEKGFF